MIIWISKLWLVYINYFSIFSGENDDQVSKLGALYFQTNPLGNDLIKMGTSGPKCQRGVTDAIFGRPAQEYWRIWLATAKVNIYYNKRIPTNK